MHKKLEAELVSLAHRILERKNNNNVTALHKKAQAICEKLSVLKFMEAYINDTPEAVANKEVIVPEATEKIVEELMEEAVEVVPEIIEVEEVIEFVEEEKIVVEAPETPKETLTHEQVEAIFSSDESLVKDDVKDLEAMKFSLEEEFKDAISSDVATELFEKVTKENPAIEDTQELKKRSLNDTLFNTNLQVGLNDRIAFVKHLFEGSQEDFNRVLSQLNSFKTEEEAKSFMQEFVKPDYDWSDKQEYETRFINIIERKFL